MAIVNYTRVDVYVSTATHNMFACPNSDNGGIPTRKVVTDYKQTASEWE